jgi:hypothetical protein
MSSVFFLACSGTWHIQGGVMKKPYSVLEGWDGAEREIEL